MSFIKLIILTQTVFFIWYWIIFYKKYFDSYYMKLEKSKNTWYIYMLSNFIFNVKLFDIKFNVNVVCNIYLHEIQN